jgi:hypothetical protein
MKKFFTLLTAVFITVLTTAQNCTITGFDVCDGTGITSDFNNAVQITGTGSPLSIGAKYKFNYAIPSLNLDAVVTIDGMVNAVMATAASPSIDDDAAANETNTTNTQSALFAPRIMPDQVLSCTNRSGYVEFTVRFYNHYTGNAAPVPGTEVAVSNLNFLHFDMDGGTVGNDGYFREIGYVKVINASNPVNYGATGTELTNGGNIGGWLLTNGSINERNGVSRCAEVIQKSVYNNAQTAISFRMGYDYKAPSTNCSAIAMQPTRQYGSRFGCFNLPAPVILPVSLLSVGVSYNDGKATVNWTSAQEQNLDRYEIQRSTDGETFEAVGYVKAANKPTVQQYQFADNVPQNAKYIFYRLRMIDADQSKKYSNTVSVRIADSRVGEMNIVPNPSNSNAQIRISITKAGRGDISVFDATGKQVLHQQSNVLAGNNNIAINDITTLTDGYYTVRLIVNNQTYTTKLIVWK